MTAGEIVFDLNISAEQWLAYYRGHVRQVHTRAVDGRTVRFPARLLHPFVTADGIHGRFRLRYDTGGHSLGLDRLR